MALSLRAKLASFSCVAGMFLSVKGSAQALNYIWRDEGHEQAGGVAIDLPGQRIATIDHIQGNVKLWDQLSGAFLSQRALSRTNGFFSLKPSPTKTKFQTANTRAQDVWSMPSFQITGGGAFGGSGAQFASFSVDGKYQSMAISGRTYFFGGGGGNNFLNFSGVGAFDNVKPIYYLIGGDARVVDMTTLNILDSFNIQGVDARLDAVMTADNTQFLYCEPNGVYSFSTATQLQTGFFDATGMKLNKICINSVGTRVAAGGSNSVRIWDKSNGAVITTLTGHHFVTGVDFSLDGSRLAVTDKTGYCKIYDALTWLQVSQVAGSKGSYVMPDQVHGTVISSGLDGFIRVRSSATGLEVRSWFTGMPFSTSAPAMALSANAAFVVTGDLSGKVAVWRMIDGAKVWEKQYSNATITAVAYNPGAQEVCVSVDQGNSDHLDVLNANNGQFVTSLGVNEYAVNITYTPNGSHLLWAGHSNFTNSDVVRRVKRSDGVIEWTYVINDFVSQNSFSLASDGSRLVVGDGTQIVKVIDALTGGVIRSINLANAVVGGLLLSPDGKELLASKFDMNDAGSQRGTLYRMNAGTGSISETWTFLDEDIFSMTGVLKDSTIVAATNASVRAFKLPGFFKPTLSSPKNP